MSELTGGRLYGEGAKGYVTDTECVINDTETFCNFTKKLKIDSITLYSSDTEEFHIKNSDTINLVIKTIEKTKQTVTKTFKGTAKNFFNKEINAIKTLYKSLSKKQIELFTTLLPIIKYRDSDIIGVEIESNNSSSYHIFSAVCASQIIDINFTEKLFQQFIEQISEALNAIHSVGITHNDISPYNLIYCKSSNRFKIIDWEIARNKQVFDGSALYNHPIKFYNSGVPVFIIKAILFFNIVFLGKYKWERNLKSYTEYRKIRTESFNKIIDLDLSRKELIRKYLLEYDNWAFGTTIEFLAEKNGLIQPTNTINKLRSAFI